MCVCVCVLYVPSVSVYTDLHSLSLFLHQVHSSNFLLIGDFNLDYLDSSSPLYHSLQTILNSYYLTQVVQEPTWVCVSGKASMIDLALLSNPSLLQSCCVIPPLSNSDHSGLCLTIRRKQFSQ